MTHRALCESVGAVAAGGGPIVQPTLGFSWNPITPVIFGMVVGMNA